MTSSLNNGVDGVRSAHPLPCPQTFRMINRIVAFTSSGERDHASMTVCRSAVTFLSLLAICWQEPPQGCFSRALWPSAPDSKSGAGLPVAGSTPVPSAWPAAKRAGERRKLRGEGVCVRRRHVRYSAPRPPGCCPLPLCIAARGKATAMRLFIVAQGWPTAGRPTLGTTHPTGFESVTFGSGGQQRNETASKTLYTSRSWLSSYSVTAIPSGVQHFPYFTGFCTDMSGFCTSAGGRCGVRRSRINQACSTIPRETSLKRLIAGGYQPTHFTAADL